MEWNRVAVTLVKFAGVVRSLNSTIYVIEILYQQPRTMGTSNEMLTPFFQDHDSFSLY